MLTVNKKYLLAFTMNDSNCPYVHLWFTFLRYDKKMQKFLFLSESGEQHSFSLKSLRTMLVETPDNPEPWKELPPPNVKNSKRKEFLKNAKTKKEVSAVKDLYGSCTYAILKMPVYSKINKKEIKEWRTLRGVNRHHYFYYESGNNLFCQNLSLLKKYDLSPVDGVPEWATLNLINVFNGKI